MDCEFRDWLQQLAQAGKGPVSIGIDRGLPFVWRIALAGEWPGAAMKASIRYFPDSPGETLVDFNVESDVPEGGSTVFTLSLTKAQTEGLPDGAGPAEIYPFDIIFSVPGAQPFRLLGGAATVNATVAKPA